MSVQQLSHLAAIGRFTGTGAPSITANVNRGFGTPTRSGPGAYRIPLDPNTAGNITPTEAIVHISAETITPGQDTTAQYALTLVGGVYVIDVELYDAGTQADGSFSLSVTRIN